MKRVIVIGSGGAGKSTFSRRLGEVTGLPVIHLDQVFWRPDWQKTPSDEWSAKVAEMVKGDSWIMDGNFGGTRSLRLAACDTVIFMDISRWVCLYRVLKRMLKYRGTNRPDMAKGCNEKVDLEFIGWILNYPRRGRKRFIEEMNSHPDKRFIILRTQNDIDDLLSSLSK